jgi:hypothetical protein
MEILNGMGGRYPNHGGSDPETRSFAHGIKRASPELASMTDAERTEWFAKRAPFYRVSADLSLSSLAWKICAKPTQLSGDEVDTVAGLGDPLQHSVLLRGPAWPRCRFLLKAVPSDCLGHSHDRPQPAASRARLRAKRREIARRYCLEHGVPPCCQYRLSMFSENYSDINAGQLGASGFGC